VGKVVVGKLGATFSSSEGCYGRDVGDRFGSRRLLLENCGRQDRVGKVFYREMWATGSGGEGCCWRNVGDRFGSGWLLFERCGPQDRVRRVFDGEMWATDSGQDGCCWRDVDHRIEFRRFSTGDVGDRFGSGWLLLERCRRQDRVPMVFDGEMWATDSDQDGCCWRDVGDGIEFRRFSTGDVGDRFGSGWLLFERYGRQVRVRRVFDGEMWATGSSSDGFRREMWATDSGQDGCCSRDVDDRFEFGGFSMGRCGRQIRIRRDVGDRFKFEHFSLERCGQHVPIGTVHMERGDKTHLQEHINGGGKRHYKLLQ
jgi:hypothetical protein